MVCRGTIFCLIMLAAWHQSRAINLSLTPQEQKDLLEKLKNFIRSRDTPATPELIRQFLIYNYLNQQENRLKVFYQKLIDTVGRPSKGLWKRGDWLRPGGGGWKRNDLLRPHGGIWKKQI